MTETANAADRITHILGLSVQPDWGVWISTVIAVLLGSQLGSLGWKSQPLSATSLHPHLFSG